MRTKGATLVLPVVSFVCICLFFCCCYCCSVILHKSGGRGRGMGVHFHDLYRFSRHRIGHGRCFVVLILLFCMGCFYFFFFLH